MRTLVGALTLLALAGSSLHAHAQALPASPGGLTVGQLVRMLPQPSRRASGSRRPAGARAPNVIEFDTSSDSFLFAAAGSVAGSGGTYFRSDVTLTNYRSTPQILHIGWIAQGVDNSNEPTMTLTLAGNTPVIYEDFVKNKLAKSGLGAILVVAVTSTGALDSAAQIDGFSRIWTTQPGASGSVSQGFPSVSSVDSIGSDAAYALGLRHDPGFRTNIGIVNLDSESRTFTVDVNGTEDRVDFSVTVLPISMKQTPIPAGNYGNLVLGLAGDGIIWSAYGSSVDNVSGDSWSAHAAQPSF